MYHEAEAIGSKSGNGSWNGMVELVRSGVAHVGVDPLSITKTRSEVLVFTDTVVFVR